MSNNMTTPRLIGTWTAPDRVCLFAGLEAVRAALARVTDDETISSIFDQVTCRPSWSLAYYANVERTASGVRISFKPGKVSRNLVIHEFGHVLALLYPGLLEELAKDGICHTILGKPAPLGGFRSDNLSDGYQMHSPFAPDGAKLVERFGDMLLNWVDGSFAPNESGATLDKWTGEHLEKWLKKGE